VDRRKSLDTLLGYTHEMERDANPAELLVNYDNGAKNGAQ
jgi:hypothetical protein